MTEKNEKQAEREALTTAADAAAFIKRKAEDYANRFGFGVAGTLSFDSQVKMDHYTSLTELADEILALAAPHASAEQAEHCGHTMVPFYTGPVQTHFICVECDHCVPVAAPAPSASPADDGIMAIRELAHLRESAACSGFKSIEAAITAASLGASPAALTDAQIREIANRSATFVSPGVYDITKFDCEEDLFTFARALLAESPAKENNNG